MGLSSDTKDLIKKYPTLSYDEAQRIAKAGISTLSEIGIRKKLYNAGIETSRADYLTDLYGPQFNVYGSKGAGLLGDGSQGIVTDDGKFYPTTNPDFVPSGYSADQIAYAPKGSTIEKVDLSKFGQGTVTQVRSPTGESIATISREVAPSETETTRKLTSNEIALAQDLAKLGVIQEIKNPEKILINKEQKLTIPSFEQLQQRSFDIIVKNALNKTKPTYFELQEIQTATTEAEKRGQKESYLSKLQKNIDQASRFYQTKIDPKFVPDLESVKQLPFSVAQAGLGVLAGVVGTVQLAEMAGKGALKTTKNIYEVTDDSIRQQSIQPIKKEIADLGKSIKNLSLGVYGGIGALAQGKSDIPSKVYNEFSSRPIYYVGQVIGGLGEGRVYGKALTQIGKLADTKSALYFSDAPIKYSAREILTSNKLPDVENKVLRLTLENNKLFKPIEKIKGISKEEEIYGTGRFGIDVTEYRFAGKYKPLEGIPFVGGQSLRKEAIVEKFIGKAILTPDYYTEVIKYQDDLFKVTYIDKERAFAKLVDAQGNTIKTAKIKPEYLDLDIVKKKVLESKPLKVDINKDPRLAILTSKRKGRVQRNLYRTGDEEINRLIDLDLMQKAPSMTSKKIVAELKRKETLGLAPKQGVVFLTEESDYFQDVIEASARKAKIEASDFNKKVSLELEKTAEIVYGTPKELEKTVIDKTAKGKIVRRSISPKTIRETIQAEQSAFDLVVLGSKKKGFYEKQYYQTVEDLEKKYRERARKNALKMERIEKKIKKQEADWEKRIIEKNTQKLKQESNDFKKQLEQMTKQKIEVSLPVRTARRTDTSKVLRRLPVSRTYTGEIPSGKFKKFVQLSALSSPSHLTFEKTFSVVTPQDIQQEQINFQNELTKQFVQPLTKDIQAKRSSQIPQSKIEIRNNIRTRDNTSTNFAQITNQINREIFKEEQQFKTLLQTPKPINQSKTTPSRRIPSPSVRLPRVPIPEKPIKKFSFNFKQKKISQDSKRKREIGFYTFVKKVNTNIFSKLNELPLTYERARDIGAYYVDNTLARTFKIIKANKDAQPDYQFFSVPEGYYSSIKGKLRDFRIKRGRKIAQGQQFIEKRKFLLESQEKREIDSFNRQLRNALKF